MSNSQEGIGTSDSKRLALSFADLADRLSLSKGWSIGSWNGQPTLRAAFGGNEARFRLCATHEAILRIVTEPYVWAHVFQDNLHVETVAPESNPAQIHLKPSVEKGSEIRVLRTSVSSGPFYVDAHLINLEMESGGEILPTDHPVPSTVFCTLGDSISGNCCIGPEVPFDPYEKGYGWRLCEHFGWQYFNAARDGSGLCRRPFDNPLAKDRVQKDVIDYQPDYLLLFYGTNDLGNGADAVSEFLPAYQELLDLLIQKLPKTRIAASGLLWRQDVPENSIHIFNSIILRVCADMKVPCCDPYEWLTPKDFVDGLHPNREGQKKLSRHFIRYFEEVFPELR